MDWTHSLRLLSGFSISGAVVAWLGWDFASATRSGAWLIVTGSAVCVVCGFYLWRRALRMRHAISGVATARLASAPQGYVELQGRARQLSAEFSTVRPHWVWQRITRSRSAPSLEVTAAPFCFSDGDTSAVILPEGADVTCKNRHVEHGSHGKTVTESIHSGEALYVLGYLSSLEDIRNLAEEAERIAADIRLDPAERRKYDVNGDGRLDVDELLKLHETAKQLAQSQAIGRETHVIARPPDGRPFLISTLPMRSMPARFAAYAWFGFVVAAAGVASAVTWASASLIRG